MVEFKSSGWENYESVFSWQGNIKYRMVELRMEAFTITIFDFNFITDRTIKSVTLPSNETLKLQPRFPIHYCSFKEPISIGESISFNFLSIYRKKSDVSEYLST